MENGLLLTFNAFDNEANALRRRPPDPLLDLVVQFVGDDATRLSVGFELLKEYQRGELSVDRLLARTVLSSSNEA